APTAVTRSSRPRATISMRRGRSLALIWSGADGSFAVSAGSSAAENGPGSTCKQDGGGARCEHDCECDADPPAICGRAQGRGDDAFHDRVGPRGEKNAGERPGIFV